MKYILLLLMAILLVCTPKAMSQPDQTINNSFEFELKEYLGTWYEIARFDHKFERGLENVTATYNLLDNGKIEVLNQGVKNGKHKKAVGKAKITSLETPRKLKVSFFLFFYAPYNILEVDENYQYALIGSETDNYLWILCRTPQMEGTLYNKLVENAELRGYNTNNLIKVKQSKE
ncbi:MAG TPA: lipocalin family protein [Prolixibacteraceae bacterium]|nr:lipocalin family protein [Prolixibacteraceae bacterium]